MDELRIKVTVRNNLLLSAIEAAGYKTQSAFARAAEIGVVQLNALVAMREPPIMVNGEFSVTAKKTMEALGACPTDLWSDAQLTLSLSRNSAEKTASIAALLDFLEGQAEGLMLDDPSISVRLASDASSIRRALNELTEKEKQVLMLRFGLNDDMDFSLEEVGKEMGVTKERVRQIEAKALRKLRNPSSTLRQDFP